MATLDGCEAVANAVRALAVGIGGIQERLQVATEQLAQIDLQADVPEPLLERFAAIVDRLAELPTLSPEAASVLADWIYSFEAQMWEAENDADPGLASPGESPRALDVP